MVKAFRRAKDRLARYFPDGLHETVEDSTASRDTRLIAVMRLLLAVFPFIFTYIDPFGPDRFVNVTYTALVLYVLYSFTVYILALTQARAMRAIRAWEHWLDVGWFCLMISLSSGTSSVFFYGFYLA